jgi:uncharacterized protein YdhG (YjbR/CyaY superfamily)
MAEGKTGAKTTPPKTVDEYIAGLSPEARPMLEQVRKVVRAVAPEATEVISYGIPTLKLEKKVLVHFGAWKSHCGVYAISSTVLEAHREELKGLVTEKGTVQFRYKEPLPAALLTKLVKAQLSEVRAGAAK